LYFYIFNYRISIVYGGNIMSNIDDLIEKLEKENENKILN